MDESVRAADLRRDAAGTLAGLRTCTRSVVRVRGKTARDALIVLDPELAMEVLADGDTFTKGGNGSRVRYLVGDGTATARLAHRDAALPPFADMSAWRRRRREALGAVFRSATGAVQRRAAIEVVGRYGEAWTRHRVVDFGEAMVRISVDSYVRSFRCEAHSDELMRAALQVVRGRDAVRRALGSRIRSAWDSDFSWRTELREMLLVFDPTTRAVRRRRRVLGRTVNAVLADSAGVDDSFFSALTTAAHRSGSSLRRADLLRSAISLFLAGWENSSTALVWLMWLVASSPAVQERLRHGPRGGQAMDHAYLRACVSEALRMYPPVWSIVREAGTRTAVGGVDVSEGDVLVVSPWILHHRPAVWERPDEFLPDRFLARGHRAGFVPFGVGERACQGRVFAMTQLCAIAEAILERWELRAVGRPPVPALGAVQYPAGRALVEVAART